MTQLIDISEREHPQCREILWEELDRTEPGEALTIIADHDPKPVLHQYRNENEDSIEWTYDGEGSDRWELTVVIEKSIDDSETVLDVREMPPPERHGTILEMFQDREVDQSLVIVNDHDPKPLFYELHSIHGDTFDWEYRRKEKKEYRVLITKKEPSQPLPEEASTRVDVRVIPPTDRHKTIFHRFDLLAPGDAMEIVADHDPVPLRKQLSETNGKDAIEWEYKKNEPDEVRILLAKRRSESDSSDDEVSTSEDTLTGVADAPELDVRPHEPQKRHELVFNKFRSLEEGGSFVLVNDHDPKPLYFQMKEEMEGNVEWDYVEEAGDLWKVQIGKRH